MPGGEQAAHPGRRDPRFELVAGRHRLSDPGNDDAMRAIHLYCDLVSGAVLDGLQAELAASGVDIGASAELPAGGRAGTARRRRARPKPIADMRRSPKQSRGGIASRHALPRRRDSLRDSYRTRGRQNGRGNRSAGQGTARQDRRRDDGLQARARRNQRRYGGRGRLAAQEGARRGGEKGRARRRRRADRRRDARRSRALSSRSIPRPISSPATSCFRRSCAPSPGSPSPATAMSRR